MPAARVTRVLLVLRPDARTHPGGDVVHAERTASALRERGIDVDVAATLAPQTRGYDVAHVFGVFEPSTARRQIAAVRSARTPLVLSPIWLDLAPFLTVAPHLERALRASTPAGIRQRLRKVLAAEPELLVRGAGARAAQRRRAQQRESIALADVVLPASNIEAYLYAVQLKVSSLPFVIVPLGVDGEAWDARSSETRSGVLCCARIEPKKNQAALLYALRDVDVDVTLVGRAYDARYLALCKRFATPRTTFVEHSPQAEVFARMARAAVHAHPSWLESPGLSSLEAAAAGARIVVGDRGTEREYFASDADYADPGDPATIRAAVLRALERPPRERGDALGQRLRDFTWQRAAAATLAGYERAFAMRR